jgi:hypothetical protein
MPFLRRSWTVRVGTYFQDSASDRIREVDILAEKRVGERLIIRVVVSVKGFPLHQTPVVYSLPAGYAALPSPLLLSAHATGGGFQFLNADTVSRATNFVLGSPPWKDSRHVVGLDTVTLPLGKTLPQDARRAGDEEAFKAIDSALKASVYWHIVDSEHGRRGRSRTVLTVPLLLTATRFWDVPIDGGQLGPPQLRPSAFGAALYPMTTIANPGFPQPIAWAMCSLDVLEKAVRAFDALAEWMGTERV